MKTGTMRNFDFTFFFPVCTLIQTFETLFVIPLLSMNSYICSDATPIQALLPKNLKHTKTYNMTSYMMYQPKTPHRLTADVT